MRFDTHAHRVRYGCACAWRAGINLCYQLPMLHPDGNIRGVWNVLVAVLICYCGIVVPLEIAFESDFRRCMCMCFGVCTCMRRRGAECRRPVAPPCFKW